MKALKLIGGVEDHVHMLLSLPATLGPAKAMQLLKANSSKWVHEEFRTWIGSNGKKDMGHSASANRRCPPPKRIFATRRRKTSSEDDVSGGGVPRDLGEAWTSSTIRGSSGVEQRARF